MRQRSSTRSPDRRLRDRSLGRGSRYLRDRDHMRHPAQRPSSRNRHEDRRAPCIREIEIELKPPSCNENPLPLRHRSNYGQPRPSSRARSRGSARECSRGRHSSRRRERRQRSLSRHHELESKCFDDIMSSLNSCEERSQSRRERSGSRPRYERSDSRLSRKSSVEHSRGAVPSSESRQSRPRDSAKYVRRSSSQLRRSSCRSSMSSTSTAHQEVTKILDRRGCGVPSQLSRHNSSDGAYARHDLNSLERRSSDGLRRNPADLLCTKSLQSDTESRVSSILDMITSLNKLTSRRNSSGNARRAISDEEDSLFYPQKIWQEIKTTSVKFSDEMAPICRGPNSNQTSTTASTGSSSAEESMRVSSESNERMNVGKNVVGRPKFVAAPDDHVAPVSSGTIDHLKVESPMSTVLTIDQRPYLKSSSLPTPTKPSPPPPRRSSHTLPSNFPPPPVKAAKSQMLKCQLNGSSTSLLGPGELTDKVNAFSRSAPPPPPRPRKNTEALLPLPPPREVKTPEPIQILPSPSIQTPDPIRSVSAGRGFDRLDSSSMPHPARPLSRERGFAPIDYKPMVPQEQPTTMLDEPTSNFPMGLDKEKKLLNRSSRVSRVENKAHVDQNGDAGLYTGEVNEDGLPNGKGKMKYDNGIYYEGKWTNGRQDSTVQRDRMLGGFTSWKGQPKNKRKGENGGGCTVYGMDWIDHSGMAGKYTGDVNDDNVPDGRGIMKYDFGLVAEGEWIKGVLNGGSRNGQMAGGATIIPGGTVVPGGAGGTVVQRPNGMSTVGGGAMSVVSGLGMMSIGGTGASMPGPSMMNQYNQMAMNPNMYQMYGYNMPGYSFR
ncbi:hypothetical protein ACHAWO_012882 [Cyclotella atomus]|uniref:Uncharacterized protein n=1 Tax=Cyclotella atomus TaxID=382360 RepID=A0ABD3QTI3_9STRA